ncbi:hypothetical protein GCM10023144_10960 [Pigmentiphaga soli]|uniref:HTH gntR-type domain-containing protein n=1 Tax=Pigmentiphaga soli TaxID=1007095 RepID=A0ABP8GM75_9BURK
MCDMFKVSRFTVRNALSRLNQKGLVSPEHGVGTRVERSHMSERLLLSLGSLAEISQFTRSTGFKILRKILIEPSEADIPLPNFGKPWLLLEGLRLVPKSKDPISLVQLHVNPAFADIADRVGKRSGPIYSLVEEMHGERVASLKQTISAVPVPAQMESLLGLEKGAPVLQIIRHYLNASGDPIEISNTISVSSRFTYSMDIETR